MQLLDSAIVITEVAFAITLALPFVHTALWVLSSITQLLSQPATTVEPTEAVPDLGSGLEPVALVAAIDQAVNKPVPVISSLAQACSESTVTLMLSDEVERSSNPIAEQEQAIVGSGSSVTVKLRQLAKLHQLPYKESGKYRRNPDLRLALQPLVSVALP